MKKWIAILCAVTLGFSVTGCGQTEEASVKQLLSEKPSGGITVSCYDTMFYKDFLEKAAKAFEKKNPGTKIKVESFAPMPEIKESQNGDTTISVVSTGNDEQERAGYISKINTELMSGEGADVLAIDIIPYFKYADGGQLEDLQAYMDADSSFDITDYRKNILDAMKYHGGQYVMPLDYMFDYLAYDASLFTENERQSLQNNNKFTYEQLMEAGKIPFQRANANSAEPIRMFGITSGSQMFRELLHVDYGKYIDIENRKVNLTDGSFAKLLDSSKEYGDNDFLPPDSESEEFSIEDFEKMKQEQFFYKTKSSYSLLGEALKSLGNSISYSIGIDTGNESNDKTLGLLSSKAGKINFNCMQAYGINSNSDNKALAWSFIKFLISDEMQSSQELSMIGFPINNAARMEKAKMDISGITGISPAEEAANQSEELTAEQKKAYDYYIKSIEDFSDVLNYYPIEDDTINHMIDKEVAYYFDGSKTADEVAKTLQDKIELYLNE